MSSPSPRLERYRVSWPVLTIMAVSALGCSVMGRFGGSSPVSPYMVGVVRLADGDFASAEQAFRESASSCESGREGRRALLFLSLTGLGARPSVDCSDEARVSSASIGARLRLPSPCVSLSLTVVSSRPALETIRTEGKPANE